MVLTCRRREASLRRPLREVPLDDCIIPLLEQAGFIGVARLDFIQLDWHLVSALVERWRSETHTFHMVHGEITITLQDVTVQLGLPCDGDVVTGRTSLRWSDECERLLGVRPPQNDLHGSRLSLAWLGRTFGQLPDGAGDEDVRRHARAYIMQLLGGVLFVDKSQSLVHLMFLPLLEDFARCGQYSWGSACLGWLYRQLCLASDREVHDIGGPLVLLQIWAWDRFPHIAPMRRQSRHVEGGPLACRWGVEFDVTEVATHVLREYREAFDRQTRTQVVWQPYSEEVLSKLLDYCLAGRDIWRARVPLICFHIVEWCFPDRVMRQFGGVQSIPEVCNTEDNLHLLDLRGKTDMSWVELHDSYIQQWGARRDRIVPLDLIIDTDVAPDYDTWYRNITRRYISRIGAMLGYLTYTLVDIQEHARRGGDDALPFIEASVTTAIRVMEDNGGVHFHDVVHGAVDDDADEVPPPAPPPVGRGRGRVRGRARGRARGRDPPVEHRHPSSPGDQGPRIERAHGESSSMTGPSSASFVTPPMPEPSVLTTPSSSIAGPSSASFVTPPMPEPSVLTTPPAPRKRQRDDIVGDDIQEGDIVEHEPASQITQIDQASLLEHDSSSQHL